MTNDLKQRGLTTKQAASYLGISESTLRQGRMDGIRRNRLAPPPFVKLGKKVLYLVDDLNTWLEAHRVGGGQQK